MQTYTQSSHPLDIAAGIQGAICTDDLQFMLADVLPTEVLDALIGWIDGMSAEQDEEIEALTRRVEALTKKLAKS